MSEKLIDDEIIDSVIEDMEKHSKEFNQDAFIEEERIRMLDIIYNTDRPLRAEGETDKEFSKRILENTKNS
jgi:hypothetical protein